MSPNISHPTPAQSAGASFDLQVYYKPGLETKHWIALQTSSTFLELKQILALPAFTNIPIEKQKLIWCGVIPRDTDTMAQHGVQHGCHRMALVKVHSPEELQKDYERGVEREEEAEPKMWEEYRSYAHPSGIPVYDLRGDMYDNGEILLPEHWESPSSEASDSLFQLGDTLPDGFALHRTHRGTSPTVATESENSELDSAEGPPSAEWW